jgi:hypothetical protein
LFTPRRSVPDQKNNEKINGKEDQRAPSRFFARSEGVAEADATGPGRLDQAVLLANTTLT